MPALRACGRFSPAGAGQCRQAAPRIHLPQGSCSHYANRPDRCHALTPPATFGLGQDRGDRSQARIQLPRQRSAGAASIPSCAKAAGERVQLDIPLRTVLGAGPASRVGAVLLTLVTRNVLRSDHPFGLYPAGARRFTPAGTKIGRCDSSFGTAIRLLSPPRRSLWTACLRGSPCCARRRTAG